MSKCIRSIPPVAELKAHFARGGNIAHLLSEVSSLPLEEIIEISYDIQSGSYSKVAISKMDNLNSNMFNFWQLMRTYLSSGDVFLDCGAGELTSLSVITHHLPTEIQLLACDISLSRLMHGRIFADRFMRPDIRNNLKLFVADMVFLPLANNSVDVIFTSHSLEPNHGRELQLLSELIRVARRTIIMFEPSWENASGEIRRRMIDHGYIRGLPEKIIEAGGCLISTTLVPLIPGYSNPQNPTYCYIIEKVDTIDVVVNNHYMCPLSGKQLTNNGSYLCSQDGGWAYPEIDCIPCLRQKNAILLGNRP